MVSSALDTKIKFVMETPELHSSKPVQDYISQEITKPSKGWVHDVLLNKRETENVKLRTDSFVLLPDTNANKRQYRPYARGYWGQHNPGNLPRWASSDFSKPCGQDMKWPGCSLDPDAQAADVPPSKDSLACAQHSKAFSWLAILTDPSIRTIRDLRGHHVKMLEDIYDTCVKVIEAEHGIGGDEVMVYANYPPSVYRLHLHFCAPFAYSSAFDAFRIHPLKTIINNLKVDGDYYSSSCLQIPVHASSELHRVLTFDRHLTSEDET